jgi:glyoxylase-like metal-dependent hydrolase (beta-lactamase superfamily II)
MSIKTNKSLTKRLTLDYKDLQILQIESSPIRNKTYIVYSQRTMGGFVIDPSLYTSKILHVVGDLNLTIEKIFLTHHHFDHAFGLNKLAKNFEAPVAIHYLKKDWFGQKYPHLNVNWLEEGDEFVVADTFLKVLHTPGHVMEHCCFKVNDYLFTGDTLFIGAVGDIWSETSNLQDLYHSFGRIAHLPSETVICPGHNIKGDYGILGEEMKTNLHLRLAFDRALKK